MKRIYLLLLFLFLLSVSASGVVLEEKDNLISLKVNNEPIGKVLEELSRRYSFKIDYGNNPLTKRITTDIQKQSLEHVITRILQKTDNKNYVIYYDKKGTLKKIRFLKIKTKETEETEEKPLSPDSRVKRRFRTAPEEMPPVVPPDLPEPSDDSEEISRKTNNSGEINKEIPEIQGQPKKPIFVPPRRSLRE